MTRWGVMLVAAAMIAFAQGTPEERGVAIAREADRRDAGYRDSNALATMILKDRKGETQERRLRVRMLEASGDNDGDKLLVIFDEPRDVAGTAFLTFVHRSGPDDQWLYLPALKRVKRIASTNKSSPFMGSEFAYEDLASQEVEKYRYLFLRDETIDGRPAFVVERRPADRDSGYARQVVWYDQQTYRPEKVEFYDRKNEFLKTLTYSKYRLYLGKHWRAGEMLMDNRQTGKSTTLVWTDYEFATGLTDRDFDQNALRRSR